MIQFLFVFMHGSSNYPEKQKHCHRIIVNAAICAFRWGLFLEKRLIYAMVESTLLKTTYLRKIAFLFVTLRFKPLQKKK